MKTIDLTSNLNISLVDNYQEVLAPECIYIPVNDDSKVFINIPSQVLKDDLILINGCNNYFASISGTATEIVKFNNKKYIKIKNNYLEESTLNTHSRHLSSLTKKLFLELLNDVNLGKILDNSIDTLYVNCIDDEPYVFNNYNYLDNNMDDVLKICRVILKLFNYKKIVFVIKQSYQKLINKYVVTISEYGSMEMISVPNIYPIGNMDLLKKTINHNNNDEFIYLSSLIKIIYKVQKNKIKSTSLVTFNGNNVLNPIVFSVKKYTLLSELCKSITLKDSNYLIRLNNSLCGNIINSLDIPVDDNIKGVIFNKMVDAIELPCNNCGYCYDVCPVKINPLKSDEKCLKCGLCNYVCPMKINIVARFQDEENKSE